MKRLREQRDSADANEAYGAALLARVGPLQPSFLRKNRLRFALQRSMIRTARHRRRPRVVLAVLLMSTTAASAMAVRFIIPALVPPLPGVETAASGENGSRGSSARVGAARPRVPSSPLPPLAAMPDTSILDRSLSTLDGNHPAARSSGGTKPARSRARPPMVGLAEISASSGPGASLVIQGMQARRAGDLNRAADMFAEYRRIYPDGALQEEALALAIEVAASRDSNVTSGLAALYLARYPNGRFGEQARRALKGTLR